MHTSSDPALDFEALNALTFGDLCHAIETGRIDAKRRGAAFEFRHREALLWSRRERALRRIFAPLAVKLSLDLDVGGCF
jgi:hypothetical protein